MMKFRLTLTVLFISILAVASAQAGGDAARGAELADSDCAMCHGDNGMGDEETPSLAGMDPAKHVAMLKGYAAGEIEDESEMMGDVASALSEQDMADVAAYYESLGGN